MTKGAIRALAESPGLPKLPADRAQNGKENGEESRNRGSPGRQKQDPPPALEILPRGLVDKFKPDPAARSGSPEPLGSPLGSPLSDVGPMNHWREPLSPLSPSGGGSSRRTVDMGDTPILQGGGAITSAQRYQETAAKKRWKKLRSLVRGAKTLDALATKKKGDVERTLILRQAGPSKKKAAKEDDDSDSGFSNGDATVTLLPKSKRRGKKALDGENSKESIMSKNSKESYLSSAGSVTPETELSDLVGLLEREIHVTNEFERRYTKVFCPPGEEPGLCRIPVSYMADLCKADLRKRQGFNRINEAMQTLHRHLRHMLEPELPRHGPFAPAMSSRPRSVPAASHAPRRKPAPVGAVSDAQRLLDTLRHICASTAMTDPEQLVELLLKTLEGMHFDVREAETDDETSEEAEAPAPKPFYREGRRASV